MEKIVHLGKLSIYIAKLNFLKNKPIPTFSYFDGGSYFKLSFYWFRNLIEFSRPKKDKNFYKKVDCLKQEIKEEIKKQKRKKK